MSEIKNCRTCVYRFGDAGPSYWKCHKAQWTYTSLATECKSRKTNDDDGYDGEYKLWKQRPPTLWQAIWKPIVNAIIGEDNGSR